MNKKTYCIEQFFRPMLRLPVALGRRPFKNVLMALHRLIQDLGANYKKAIF